MTLISSKHGFTAGIFAMHFWAWKINSMRRWRTVVVCYDARWTLDWIPMHNININVRIDVPLIGKLLCGKVPTEMTQ
jgi:hypothetical protein